MGRSQMPKYIFAAVLSLAACAATPQPAPEELNEPTLYDFLLGEIALQRGDVTLAAKTYLELAKHTRDPRVARRAVEVANLARLPELAIEAAKTWLDIEPSSPQALQVTAALLIASRRVEEAEPYLEKLLASDGVNLENGFMQLSRLLAANPDKSANLRVVRQLAGKHPKLAPAQFAIAQAALVAGDDDAALAAARSAAALRPEWEPPAVLEAQVLQKRWPRAIEWYEQIVSGEQVVPARLRAASAIAKQGKLDEARAYLKRAAEDNPDQEVQLIVAEAQLLREANHSRDAFELLGQALRKDPEQPDLLYDMALTAEKLERYEQMESNLRKLIEVQPEHAHAYNALGYSFAERNTRLAEARKLIEKALELSPEDYFIIDSLGWVLYREGNLKGAAEQLRRAYSGRPDAEIGAHLGEVLWVMGRRDEAERIWQESIKSAPENDTLQKTIKRFKR